MKKREWGHTGVFRSFGQRLLGKEEVLTLHLSPSEERGGRPLGGRHVPWLPAHWCRGLARSR